MRALTSAVQVRAESAAWTAHAASSSAIVACDPAMCPALQAAGLPATSLLVLRSSAPDPLGADIVVATPAIRSQFGPRLTSVYAPLVLATFGTGPLRIEVRTVAADGAASYLAKLAADLRASKADGATLLGNSSIEVAPAARAQLAAGLVDPRLLVTFPALAQSQPVRILGFSGRGPGAAPDVAFAAVVLSAADPRSALTPGKYQSWLLGFLNSQRVPFQPAHITVTHGRTPTVLIQFGLPYPLDLLGNG